MTGNDKIQDPPTKPAICESTAMEHVNAYHARHGYCDIDPGGDVEYTYQGVTGWCLDAPPALCNRRAENFYNTGEEILF